MCALLEFCAVQHAYVPALKHMGMHMGDCWPALLVTAAHLVWLREVCRLRSCSVIMHQPRLHYKCY